MGEDLKALFIEQEKQAADALSRALRPEFFIPEPAYTPTFHKAVQFLLDEDFDICFISDKFPLQDAEAFLRDFGKLNKERTCIFVQVRDRLEAEFDRQLLKQTGFQYIISRIGTHNDKDGLRVALREFLHGQEIKERVHNVDYTMQMALNEIDKAADNLRRGRKANVNKLSLDFIGGQTKFDEAVLEKYFDTLSTKTDAAQPVEVTKLEVPDGVLMKNLPNLKEDLYTGASHRVWKNLSKRYGKKSK